MLEAGVAERRELPLQIVRLSLRSSERLGQRERRGREFVKLRGFPGKFGAYRLN